MCGKARFHENLTICGPILVNRQVRPPPLGMFCVTRCPWCPASVPALHRATRQHRARRSVVSEC